MIEEVVVYRCTRCEKEYSKDPLRCTCERTNYPGKIVGPFKLIEPNNGEWKVECILCTQITTVHGSNLKRQHSCGCAPRTVRILEITESQIRFKCRHCHQVMSAELPIFQWCCD